MEEMTARGAEFIGLWLGMGFYKNWLRRFLGKRRKLSNK